MVRRAFGLDAVPRGAHMFSKGLSARLGTSFLSQLSVHAQKRFKLVILVANLNVVFHIERS